MTRSRWSACAVLLAAGATLLAACSTADGALSQSGGQRVVQVVAAENFWGSIASQIGGPHVHVTSIITNPNADPHSYEPTADDARTLAEAGLVIENGIGYDPWVSRLLAASGGQPAVLDVGTLLGIAPGGNPHRWYNPADVQAVITAMAADFSRADPADRAYFHRQRDRFNAVALERYHQLIAAIKARYSGTPVGASESIFAMLTIDHQIRSHLIGIYVYNSQNVTPDVQAQLTEARAERIPTATITETLVPATSTYQAWQVMELRGIEAALTLATGR